MISPIRSIVVDEPENVVDFDTGIQYDSVYRVLLLPEKSSVGSLFGEVSVEAGDYVVARQGSVQSIKTVNKGAVSFVRILNFSDVLAVIPFAKS